MTNDDDLLAIAARVADGTGIDWSTADSTSSEVEDLKAIAHIAALHRAPSVEARSPRSGRRWGSLTIIEEVGAGRSGRVYRAWDARLERFVALKILDAASSPAVASPLKSIDEARLLARVRHPNVLIVHGAESIDGQVGIWTEFIEGRTLERILTERGPLPPEEVAAIGLDLCRALGAVHEAGLLHRDVKAQNVMRETGGRIVLMDFGAGHDLDQFPPRAGDLTGTPLYLAPELFNGRPPSPATDVYALAVLLFRLLTGTYPVTGRTLGDVRAEHQAGRPTRRVRDVRADAPEGLIRAIEGGLAVDEGCRYSNALAFEAALATTQREGEPSGSVVARLRSRSWRLAGAGILMVGLAAGAATLLKGRQRGQTASAPEKPPSTQRWRLQDSALDQGARSQSREPRHSFVRRRPQLRHIDD